MSLIQIYVNNQGKSFILRPECPDVMELSKSLWVSQTELIQSYHEFLLYSSFSLFVFLTRVMSYPSFLFPASGLSLSWFARQHMSNKRWVRLKWLLKYPSPQITSLVVLIPSFGLMKLYAPCTTTKMLANVFYFTKIITTRFHLKIHTCQQTEPKSTNLLG